MKRKTSHVGYILMGDEMERLMRRAERAKQDFVREQTGKGFTSLGRDVLRVDTQTRPLLSLPD